MIKNNKIGIIGGTFDPIHTGHLFIANEALNKYNLKKVIFIPCGIPPHKKNTNVKAEDRYIMTILATMSNDRFEVSDIEIKDTEKSYTLNTIIKLEKIYKESELYFITGSDAIIDIPSWYKPELLTKKCKFIAVNRPGKNFDEVNNKIEEIKKRYNAYIDILSIPMLEISSSDIRYRMFNNISSKYLLPELVLDYIMKHKLYTYKINSSDEIMELIKNSLSQKLFLHAIRTKDEAVKLCKIYGVNVEKAKIAALLHDCGKNQILNYDDNLLHGERGANIAKNVYNIEDEDILNAIRFHTTGRKYMTILEKIIYIADKIEPGRTYDGVEDLRHIAYENIDIAIINSINKTSDYVKKKGITFDEKSLEVLEWLKGELN